MPPSETGNATRRPCSPPYHSRPTTPSPSRTSRPRLWAIAGAKQKAHDWRRLTIASTCDRVSSNVRPAVSTTCAVGPWLVVSIQDLLPSREYQTGDIGDARLDPLAMLALVATDQLDLHELHCQARRGLAPIIASSRHWIDRVDDDSVSDAQIVLSKIASGKISLWSRHVEGPRSASPARSCRCVDAPPRSAGPATWRGPTSRRRGDHPGQSASPTPVGARVDIEHGIIALVLGLQHPAVATRRHGGSSSFLWPIIIPSKTALRRSLPHTAQIVPPEQPPVAILYLSSGMSRVDLATRPADEISVPKVLVQRQVVRIQEACAAHLRQGENVQVIRLASAFILQLSQSRGR